MPDTGAFTNLHIRQTPCAGKSFANDLHFCIVLGACREMLPVATSATISHVTARGLHTRGSGRRNTHEPGSREIAFRFDKFSVDVLTCNDAFNEHHTTIGVARHTITASDQSIDVQSTYNTNFCG